MQTQLFSLDEIPFDELEQYGLTRNMFEDLSAIDLVNIGKGKPSPVLPMYVQDSKLGKIRFRARFSLVRRGYKTDVLVYPICRNRTGVYSELGNIRLEKGQTVLVQQPNIAGTYEPTIFQADSRTGHLIGVTAAVVMNNLESWKKNCALQDSEVDNIIAGRPTTVILGERPCTIGIDLNSPTCIRSVIGDLADWQEAGKEEREKYQFGEHGCWITDDNGDMDYFAEDEWTDEIWLAQKRQGERSEAMSRRTL